MRFVHGMRVVNVSSCAYNGVQPQIWGTHPSRPDGPRSIIRVTARAGLVYIGEFASLISSTSAEACRLDMSHRVSWSILTLIFPRYSVMAITNEVNSLKHH
jgi:hypothetical protein